MWLVIASLHDEATLWAYRGLAARRSGVELVTTETLGLALRWRHFVDTAGSRIAFELADGRKIDSSGIDGVAPRAVLSRMHTFPTDHLPPSEDAEYARTELFAFYLSWLHGLGCPVLDRATPQGLCGRWRHLTEWLWLAGRAGLPTPDYRWTSEDSAAPPPARIEMPGRTVVRAYLIGETVLLPPEVEAVLGPLPEAIREGCVRLGRAASHQLLGIDLLPEIGWAFAGADPYPDFRPVGEPALDALELALDPAIETSRVGVAS